MKQILLLRGINLGAANRVAMPQLRSALEAAGFGDVATYVQSGNVVLAADTSLDETVARVKGVIEEEFGLDIAVVGRTRDEIASVISRNPLPEAVDDPKRYQVSFLDGELETAVIEGLEELVAESERMVVSGREIYTYHREGAARSKLWNRLAGKGLGVTATARNWTTVTKLLELADA